MPNKERGISLSGVKQRNRQQIKRIIYHEAPVTRQQITDELGLTLPTITTNVSGMLAEGMLVEYDAPNPAQPSGGRRVQALDFRADAHFAVGVELGPYHSYFCVTDLRGSRSRCATQPAAPDQYGDMLDFAAQQVSALIRDAGVDRARLFGVGVGIPGYIAGGEGVIRKAFHPSWEQQPFAKDLSEKLGLPVWIDNNARMRAFGREMFTDRPVPDTFAYLLVSRGMACPLMIKNTVLAGHRASAGEIGHTTILPGGPVCPTCGRHGCLEAVSGESAILSAAAQAMKERRASLLAGILKPGESLTTEKVLEAQRLGDPAICGIMCEVVSYIALEVANIFNFISPSLMVVDGYIFAVEANRRQLEEIVDTNLYGLKPEEAKIEFLPYDPMRGAGGAAAYVIRHCLLD